MKPMSESDATAPAPRKRRRGCWIAAGILAAILLGAGIFYGPTLLDFWRTFGDALFKPEKRAYQATSEQNLKAIHQGIMLHHESEGTFPSAAKWMDEIENRLKSNDLAKGEAEKKLVRPDLLGQAGKYGYAINKAAASRYRDDLRDPAKTILVYESKQTTRNAHGDPATDRDGLAITVDGTILKESAN
jgi:hypothetical protein